MFDVGLWEVALLLVIAMIVVGPDRLPKLATSIGRFTGKIRRMAQTIQRDIDRQIALEDQQKIRESVESVRQQLNQDVMQPLSQEPTHSDTESATDSSKTPAVENTEKDNG